MKKVLLYISLCAASFLTLFSYAYAANSFNVSLGYGASQTNEIINLQNFLISQGLLHTSATGRYLSLTKKAVADFQSAHGISPVSGYFGPLTRAAANSVALASGTSEPAATITVQSVTSETNESAAILSNVKTVRWQTSGYPNGVGVNINLLRKVSDSPKRFVLVRNLFTNVPNDNQKSWTPQDGETGSDLYIEVTCSTTYKFSGNCQLGSEPIKVN